MGAEDGSLIPPVGGAQKDQSSSSVQVLGGADLLSGAAELLRIAGDYGDGHPESPPGERCREEPPKRIREGPSETGSQGSDQPPGHKKPFEDQTGVMHDDVPPWH